MDLKDKKRKNTYFTPETLISLFYNTYQKFLKLDESEASKSKATNSLEAKL